MPSFDFAFDGKPDLMSLNPFEATNFEMMGAICGIAGVVVAILLSRRGARRQKPHVFSAVETDEDAIG